MNEARPGRSREIVFTVLAAILSLAALATLVPRFDGGAANILGYRSWCSFAPGSTLLLLMGVAFCWVARHAPEGTE